MGMDREFSWNLPSIEKIREDRERAQLGMMDSERLKAQRALRFQDMLEQGQQAQQQEMADAAAQARWLELENKFAQRTHDPKMKMAAMLAMAGEPGALQSALSLGLQGLGGKEAQSEMDSLETSIANDLFALAGASDDDYDKLTSAIIPLYRSKFEELLGKGAKSRMGATWDAGWGTHFDSRKDKRQGRKAKAAARKAGEKGLLP